MANSCQRRTDRRRNCRPARLHAAIEDEKDVRRDHDLLYGITANAKVPPFELSIDRSRASFSMKRRWTFGTSIVALGLQAPKLNREPDDHIGLELDFLAQCCISALTALEQGSSTSPPNATCASPPISPAIIYFAGHRNAGRAPRKRPRLSGCGALNSSRGAIHAWKQAVEDVA